MSDIKEEAVREIKDNHIQGLNDNNNSNMKQNVENLDDKFEELKLQFEKQQVNN